MSIATQIVTALTPLGAITPWADADRNSARYMTYHLVSGFDNGNLAGAGPKRQRYQIDCYSTVSQKDASGLAASAKVALRAGLAVGAISDNPDGFETTHRLYRASFDVACWEK